MVDFFGPEEPPHPLDPPRPIHPHPSAGHRQHREGSTGVGSTGRTTPAGPGAGGMRGTEDPGPGPPGAVLQLRGPPSPARGPDPAAAQARSSPCLRPGAARPRSRPGPEAFPKGSQAGTKPPSPSDPQPPQPGRGCSTSIPLRTSTHLPLAPLQLAMATSKRLGESKEGSGKGCSPPTLSPARLRGVQGALSPTRAAAPRREKPAAR